MNVSVNQFPMEMGAARWVGDPDFNGLASQRDAEDKIREKNVRQEAQNEERLRIARELHDTLLQGFLGASLVLHEAVDQLPDGLPAKSSLGRALQLMNRVIEEGRAVVQGLRTTSSGCVSLEQALSELGDEFVLGAPRLRVFVMGTPKRWNPLIGDQVYLIAREALANAMRHSQGTRIEAEVEYRADKVRVVVRDNGIGIDAETLQTGRDSHWGLAGMSERASAIGADLRIWSRPGAGTEVEISVANGGLADGRAPLRLALQETAVA